MTCRHLFRTTALCAIVLAPLAASAQGRAGDYERANGLRVKYEGLALDVTFDGVSWRCSLTDYVCKKAPAGEGRGGGRGRGAGPGAFVGIPGPGLSNRRSDDNAPRVSPDGKWEALVNNYNVAIRAAG